ncbi:nitroreductase/quinone reductase family protein [Actinoplanes sp. NPDC049596]|uniref:nitroreductase/quinone reductase family protein n=1 Tax=unclassified Actinoplanes TaxID=2626549 RepID=UPI0034120242
MWRRFWRTAGTLPFFTPVARRLVRVDRWLGRRTRGRVVALGMAPGLVLTTTGRKSGLPRSSPLLYLRDGDDLAIIGSNWGGPTEPQWVGNLLADPRAHVTVDGEELPVTAAETTGAEYDRLWQLIVTQWPGYQAYVRKAAGRPIRIFRLAVTRHP